MESELEKWKKKSIVKKQGQADVYCFTETQLENFCFECKEESRCKVYTEGQCPTHTNMPNSQTKLKTVEETRQKLNKVYLRLAYGKSDIEVAKKEVDEIITLDRHDIERVLVEKVSAIKADSKLLSSDPNKSDEYISRKQVLTLVKEVLQGK